MALDDVVDLVGNALHELGRRQRATDEGVAALRGKLDALLDVLAAKEVLGPGNQKHIERCGQSGGDARPRVRLSTYDPDKYNMLHGEPVDCADRMPLCKGRCCKLTIVLTEQDLDEGKLKWDLQEPYVLRRAQDRRCIYQDRTSGFCTNYEHRPATCRGYSCRNDRRIWLDFDNKIPAPAAAIPGNTDDELSADRDTR